MKVETNYVWMQRALRNMTEGQLIELFHDLHDDDAVERIANCAKQFNVKMPKVVEEAQLISSYSEYQDWKEQDDAQRLRDIKSEEGSIY